MSADQKILYFVVLGNICQTISKYQKKTWCLDINYDWQHYTSRCWSLLIFWRDWDSISISCKSSLFVFAPRLKCNITLTRGGMYWKLRPPRTERFAEVLILHPEAREIARGRSPRAISRAEGCKINAEANLEVRGGRNFQWIPTLVSVITFFFPRRGCFDFSFWPAHCVL